MLVCNKETSEIYIKYSMQSRCMDQNYLKNNVLSFYLYTVTKNQFLMYLCWTIITASDI